MPAEPLAAARLRGVAAGLLTATLAIAAHGAADSAIPSGTAVALLAVLAATVGGLTATVSRAADARVLVGMLAIGQFVGHVMLAAAGHSHGAAAATPASAMLVAHAVAVVAGAFLIAAGDRLCRAVSRVVEVAVRAVVPPVPTRFLVVAEAVHPLRSVLLLAASLSHRGPPVSPAR